MSDQVFEELPPAIAIPMGSGYTEWQALFLADAPDGNIQQGKVYARVHPDEASDIRLKKEQRGNMMCGMLIDTRGKVYGLSAVYVGGGEPETIDDVATLSQVDIARARLIDLASAWRRTGLDLVGSGTRSGHAELYARCAQQLDEVVVELLATGQDMDLDVDDVDDGRDG